MVNKKIIGIVILIVGLLSFMILSMRNFEVFAGFLFWDLNAFIMITIIPSLIIMITYSISDVSQFLISIFTNKFENEIKKNRVLIFLKYLKNTLIYSGIFTFFFSLMMMFSDISSVEVIGKNLGTAICSILYSLFIVLIFIHPTENRIKQSFTGDI